MSDRPNIIFICTDHQTADAMSCAGNPYLQTPAMDRIAAHGVRFTQAYCPFPLCLPCRASMFTGQLPSQLGIHDNSGELSDEQRHNSLGNLLSRAGYDCAYAGKWHVAKGTTPDAGFGFDVLCGFEDDRIADVCCEFLQQPRERPFFLVASYDNPHNICQWARSQSLPWGAVPDVPTAACPELPANFAVPPFEPSCIRREVQSNVGCHPTFDWTPEHWRHYRHAFYRLVEQVDRELLRIIETLRETGAEQRTLIVFLSDHGDGMAAHQLNQKSFLYQEQTNVPLLVAWPGHTAAGRVDSESLISTGLDLLPTLCDYAQVAELPAGLRGASWRPLLAGDTAGWRDQIVCETKLYRGTQGRMLRTARYKYVVYDWGRYREQLFDLVADPGEMVNLAESARYLDVLQQHREKLQHAYGERLPWVTDEATRYGQS